MRSNFKISGCFNFQFKKAFDERGGFFKPYSRGALELLGVRPNFSECFYSTSKRGVIRGMHFQIPPFSHEKLVFVVSGEILDVVLDLRIGSKTYGEFSNITLAGGNGSALYIPAGVAHGFQSLTADAVVGYLTTAEHHPNADQGIHYKSFGMQWPISPAIVSSRDNSFQALSDFYSPFRF